MPLCVFGVAKERNHQLDSDSMFRAPSTFSLSTHVNDGARVEAAAALARALPHIKDFLVDVLHVVNRAVTSRVEAVPGALVEAAGGAAVGELALRAERVRGQEGVVRAGGPREGVVGADEVELLLV